jgi:hypothetical protein
MHGPLAQDPKPPDVTVVLADWWRQGALASVSRLSEVSARAKSAARMMII